MGEIDWILIFEIIYLLILIAVCIRIIYDSGSNSKALAYLLFAVFIPFLGMIFYFSFGINYRKNQLYTKKIIQDDHLWEQIKQDVESYSVQTYNNADKFLRPNKHLAKFLSSEMSPLTTGNQAQLLVNGETKFPAVLKELAEAKDHIHIEYYIYENDKIGKAIEQLLVKKVKEGVRVRFMFDDFGSKGIRRNLAKRLRSEGIETYPFYKIRWFAIANHLNYRNHRKIIIIDGKKAFVGGINVSDKYINEAKGFGSLFWRDTHLLLEGPGVYYLQYLFISDWNFCTGKTLENVKHFFPSLTKENHPGNKLVQIAASGPDSRSPTILYSLLYAIYQAEEEILVTTPYFIPEQSIMDALVVAALGGVSVNLLVPEKGDSSLVALAASSYYDDLLDAGVKLYFYKKGFVHAKTIVADRKLAIVGTANMDYRSFDLNFEVNAIVYDAAFAESLAKVFEDDLKDAVLIENGDWANRSRVRKLLEKTARLVSPLL